MGISPPPTNPILDPAMLTLSVTSSPGPIAVPPSISAVPQINSSSLEISLDMLVVSDSDPIPDMLVVQTTEPSVVNTNLKGWKNMLVRNSETVDPNFVLVYSLSKEGTSIELPDIILDCILQNMANNLVGNFFSLRDMVEMVIKWVKDK